MENGTHSTKLSEVTGPTLDIPIPILHHLIDSSVATHGEKVALVCKHQTPDVLPAVSSLSGTTKSSKSHLVWTHRQLQHGAGLLACALQKHGVQPKSTIAVLLSGRAEFHMVLRAAVKLNCPFTPMNLRSAQNAQEIRHMLTLSDAKAVIVEDATLALHLEKNVPDLMREMQVKVMAGSEATVDSYVSLNELVSEAARDEDFQARSQALDKIDRQLDDTVFIWFTSGTTSLPKAAPHTNKTLTANMRSWGEAFKLDDTRAWLHILPMNSIVGSSWTLAYLIPGGSVTHCNYNFDVDSIARTILTGECTDMLPVPSMIDLLANSPLLESENNGGVAHIIVGGSKILRSHVEKSFKYLKCKRFSPFFGMTEGTSLCTETLYEVPANAQDAIHAGYVCPGAKIRVCSSEVELTDPLPRGEPGELVQGGLQKIERYLGGKGADSFFTAGGETWFRTGDQAVMGEDGRITIVGRYKDMIIRGGMNIASATIEAVIAEVTGIEAQIIGIPDEVAGEVPVAIVKGSEKDRASFTAIQKCSVERLGGTHALERVLLLQDLGVDEWPKTTSGKVLKRELQIMMQDLLRREGESDLLNGEPNGEVDGHFTHEVRERLDALSSQLVKINGDSKMSPSQYHDLKTQLESMRVNLENVETTSKPKTKGTHGTKGSLQLSEDELQKYLLEKLQSSGILVSTIDEDFHSAGMDSLQAIRLRNAVVKNIDLGADVNLPANVVFEAGNIRQLASRLKAGNSAPEESGSHNIARMAAMIGTYSIFRPHEKQDGLAPEHHTALLTGATGSLGAHLLQQLIQRNDVKAVYCPVRGQNPAQRIEESMRQRSLVMKDAVKLHAVPFDSGKIGFGLEESVLQTLRSDLTLVIHAAWPVNFQLSLASFEPHLRGLQSLIQLSLDVKSPRPARLLFCSSMGVALGTQGRITIPEEPIQDLRQAAGSGYAQSKLVCERVVQNAVLDFGASASNLRIGQIVGDTMHGVWNETEAPPLMIRSALSLGKLPAFEINYSWIPVDTLASAITELATRTQEPRLVYNLSNPRKFSWANDFLPALSNAGLKFSPTPFETWLAELKAFSSSHSVEEAIDKCPAVKLIDYYEASFGKDVQNTGVIEFSTDAAEKDCEGIRDAPDVVRSGLVERMLGSWMEKWTGGR